tara:strand:+ start:232 stop:528 length:297 start_codon:yes stop_codon:yes gene_type:complete
MEMGVPKYLVVAILIQGVVILILRLLPIHILRLPTLLVLYMVRLERGIAAVLVTQLFQVQLIVTIITPGRRVHPLLGLLLVPHHQLQVVMIIYPHLPI